MTPSLAGRTHFGPGQFLGARVDRAHFGPFAVGVHVPTVPAEQVATHTHADAHFVLILEGDYHSSARGWRDDAPLPALIYNPPGTTHRDRFERCAGGRFLTISIDALAVADTDIGSARRHGSEPSLAPPHGAALARRLALHLADWDDSARLAGESVCFELLALTMEAPARRVGGGPKWIRTVCDRLGDACETAPSIGQLARALGLHPVYLAREFRRAVGCSPGEYLRHHRIERAASLLAASRAPLTEIALQCGFADQSHFTRQFRAAFGASPSAYRRRRLGRVARVQDPGSCRH